MVPGADTASEPRRGRPPRTASQRAEQRARLIEGAMKAIRERGSDASIDEMAAAAGVSKPVLYDEFGGKLGLADAIALVLAEQLERAVVAEVARRDTFDISVAVRAFVDAFVNLIDDEPELYAYLVRAIRVSDRRFLDNALVRVLHERASLFVNLVAPGMPEDHLAVLTDGLFGFVFAAVESWQATKKPAKTELVRILTVVIREGFRGAAEQVVSAG